MKTEFWVFDTNTLVSALLMANSTPALALRKARANGSLLISAEIAHEYFDVFSRPKFDKYISLEIRLAFIENIITNALPVEIKIQTTACRDPKDNKFLDLAINAAAGAIITGDQDLLVLHPFQTIPILTPAGFLSPRQ
jgi:putative PIN family toxin of toxin-antitoxin system